MPVIRTDADRREDARISDDLADWQKASEIASLKTKDERNAAMEALLIETDEDYYVLIKTRAAGIYNDRLAKAKALADKASEQYRKTFNTGGSRKPVKPSKRSGAAASKRGTLANAASLLNELNQGEST